MSNNLINLINGLCVQMKQIHTFSQRWKTDFIGKGGEISKKKVKDRTVLTRQKAFFLLLSESQRVRGFQKGVHLYHTGVDARNRSFRFFDEADIYCLRCRCLAPRLGVCAQPRVSSELTAIARSLDIYTLRK